MTIKIVEETFSPREWNEAAKHPLQAWEWGEARKQMNVDVLRVGEFDGNELKNVFQLTLHEVPLTNLRMGYLPRSSFPSKEVLDFLYEWCKENKVVDIKIEPYEQEKPQLDSSYKIIQSQAVFPEWTQILDLTQAEEDILKNMKSKTRYNIRLAEKKGVTVREESNEEGFKIFSKLYFATTKRQKYFGHNEDYHQEVWNSLKNGIAHLLIAYYKNIPLVAYEIFHFKDKVYYVYGGSSEEHRNLMAAQLIMWETIKWGKKNGAKILDMWGSLPPDYDPTHPWAGFTRFKEGYGGKFIQFSGSYDFVVNKNLYALLNFAYQLRNSYLVIKAKLR